MRLGAVISGADERTEACLAEYGHALGLAFQVVDDVLDLTAEEEILGKPVASDLREGKATLAVVHTLAHGCEDDRNAVLRVLAHDGFTPQRYEAVLDALKRNGSIDYAMQTAQHYAARARHSLEPLPDSEYKRALLWVPEFVVGREK